MLPAAAQASTVTVRHVSTDSGVWDEAYYVADPGERNDLVIGYQGDALRLVDSGADIRATGRCRSVNVHTVVCRARGFGPDVAHVVLGDLDDRIGPARK